MDVRLRNNEKIRVLNGADLYEVMQKILKRSSKIDQKKEHLWIVGLDVTQEILFIELVGLGTSKMVNVEPKMIFNLALKKEAFQIILVHNHPSGNLTPSNSDKELTHRMLFVGKFADIPVWDHLIITDKSYFSFLDSGVLEQLEADTSNVPSNVLESIYRSEKETAEKELIFKTTKIVINLHNKGIPSNEIADLTTIDQSEVDLIIQDYKNGDIDNE